MSLDPIPVTEVPLQRKMTKSRLQRGDSDSSTSTTASQTSRDMATQTTAAAPPPATDFRHAARMSGGASSDKSVTFASSPPAFYPSERRDPGLDFVHDKAPMRKATYTTNDSSSITNKNSNNKARLPPKRPSFKRNLSSFWRLLDPPELAHNSGVLHNLVKTEEDQYRGWKKGSEGMTLDETMGSRRERQR